MSASKETVRPLINATSMTTAMAIKLKVNASYQVTGKNTAPERTRDKSWTAKAERLLCMAPLGNVF